MKISSILMFALFTLAMTPAPGHAADNQLAQQDDGVCMGDAMSVCGQFIPDRGRVAHCLMSNRNRVSAPCRVALTRWRD